ncbi:hypothetical protein QBC38DRAFT_459715 [Podospora fimiseda]|uniref:Uncharacterized protein n=1 Tax=Podospora fimiseda TaxID=252190 RepID=A0AAN7GWB8_9PEZI|nr:hypothetical protein QBC38DRAFT_459715 [Podospora fimiseda]
MAVTQTDRDIKFSVRIPGQRQIDKLWCELYYDPASDHAIGRWWWGVVEGDRGYIIEMIETGQLWPINPKPTPLFPHDKIDELWCELYYDPASPGSHENCEWLALHAEVSEGEEGEHNDFLLEDKSDELWCELCTTTWPATTQWPQKSSHQNVAHDHLIWDHQAGPPLVQFGQGVIRRWLMDGYRDRAGPGSGVMDSGFGDTAHEMASRLRAFNCCKREDKVGRDGTVGGWNRVDSCTREAEDGYRCSRYRLRLLPVDPVLGLVLSSLEFDYVDVVASAFIVLVAIHQLTGQQESSYTSTGDGDLDSWQEWEMTPARL